MADWVTISSLATAGGTLVLAVATFSSVRSANRSAAWPSDRCSSGLRPVLIPSREEQLDLYIPAGDTGYWQGAMRDPQEPGYPEVLAALRADDLIQIDLLYGDHEGGQRTVVRFVVSRWPEVEGRRAYVIRYWDVDRDDPC